MEGKQQAREFYEASYDLTSLMLATLGLTLEVARFINLGEDLPCGCGARSHSGVKYIPGCDDSLMRTQ